MGRFIKGKGILEAMGEYLARTVTEELEKQGLIVEIKDADLPNLRGVYTNNFTLDSNQGKVVVKVGTAAKTLKEHLESMGVRVGIAKFLEAYPSIPSPQVLANGKTEGMAYMVQKYLPGADWTECRESTLHLKHLGEVLADLHKIEIKGYGDLAFENGLPFGKHENWVDFLKEQTYQKLDELYEYLEQNPDISSKGVRRIGTVLKHKLVGKRRIKAEKEELKNKLKTFFGKHGSDMQCEIPSLLHGDVWWNNVRVEGEKVTGLIDWEYAYAGDPAWEMHLDFDAKDELLRHYFAAMKKRGFEVDEDDFKKRIGLYRVVKGIFAANGTKKTRFFKHVFGYFKNNLKSYIG